MNSNKIDIVKYITRQGECPFDDFRKKLISDGRFDELAKLKAHIGFLQSFGLKLPSVNKNWAKSLGKGLYELRPGDNRIFYFYYAKNKKIVLLHGFTKKTNETPSRELEKARKEMEDYDKRN